MPASSGPCRLSPRRAELASFEHAYAVALRMRAETGRRQLILRTGNPVQPYRVAPAGTGQSGTDRAGRVLALVA
jgi:hypothetical protein